MQTVTANYYCLTIFTMMRFAGEWNRLQPICLLLFKGHYKSLSFRHKKMRACGEKGGRHKKYRRWRGQENNWFSKNILPTHIFNDQSLIK